MGDCMDEKTKQKQDYIIESVSAFCRDELNEEYCDLAVKLVEKMGRKHDVPFKRGRLDIWASAVIYVLAQINFLFDKESPNHISAQDICDYFGTKKSTVSQKANYISAMFNLAPFDEEFSVSADCSIAEEDMDDFFNDVYHLFSNGLADDALDKLDLIEEDNPEYPRALFYKSVISSSLGDMSLANDLFREAIISEVSKSSGMDSEILREEDFGRVIDEMNEITESKEAFDLGYEQYTSEEFERALDYFDLALELNPNESEVLYYKALSLARLEDFDFAIDMIDRAIELDPDDDRFWNDKGNFLTRLGNFSEAEKCFDEAIKLNPTDSVLFANKGFMYLQAEDNDKAIESYHKACDLERNVHNLVGLGNAYADVYDFPNAEKYLYEASEIDDEDKEYLTAMAHFMMFQDELEEALKYWDRFLELYPNQADVWIYKAMIYMMMNNEFDANRCIEEAVKIDPMVLDLFEEMIEDEL